MLRDSHHEKEGVQELIRSEEEFGVLDNAYIVYFSAPYSLGEEVDGGDLPTKALLNAVGDLCQTRYACRWADVRVVRSITRKRDVCGSDIELVRGKFSALSPLIARQRQRVSRL